MSVIQRSLKPLFSSVWQASPPSFTERKKKIQGSLKKRKDISIKLGRNFEISKKSKTYALVHPYRKIKKKKIIK